MSKKKHTPKEIELASSIYHEFNYQGMLTPEQDTILADAIEVLEEAGLVDEDREWIEED